MSISFKELGRVDDLTVFVLAEDHAGYDSLFWGQFGTSFLIRFRSGQIEKGILFDAATSSEPILHNMKLLNLSPDNDIDMVVLSHCHFDHTGGLIGVLKNMNKEDIPIIAHPSISRTVIVMDPYLWAPGLTAANSMDKIEAAGGKWFLTKEPLKLAPGVMTSGEVERNFEKKVTLDSYNLEDGKLVRDEILDDLSLYFNTDEGLVIVTSCSHAGIVNIVMQATKLTGKSKIRAVIGGFHLIDADTERINSTVQELKKLGVERVITGHCTGLKAEAVFLDSFGDSFTELYSGQILNF